MKSILVVEDNPEMKILIDSSLQEFDLTFQGTIKGATEALQSRQFELILLDIGLPDGDGLRFLAELTNRPDTRNTPVMILSGKSETANKVMAFSVGAEDFISKPFDPIELNARVTAKMKRTQRHRESAEVFRAGDLQIDVLKQKVRVVTPSGPEDIELTTLEFKLLLTLARAPERIFSREYLLEEIWGENLSVNDRTVDTHVGHLRKKLARSKSKIDTVIGSGYRFLPS